MLKSLFLCIKERILTKLPEIKDVRVYNGQDVFSDESIPFMSPTVFIDFSEVEYETTSFQFQRAQVTVRVMLFHEEGTAAMNHLEVFDLNDKLNSYLNGWGNWKAGLMDRVNSDTDTNYDRLYVLSTEYITNYAEDTKPIFDGSIPIGDWSKTPFSGSTTGVTDWSWAVTGYSENNQIAFEYEIPYSANTQN